MEAFTPPDYQREDIDYHVRTIDEAIDGAEVAMLAIPNAAVAGFADQYRDRLAGAIIIDPSNPFLWHDDGVMTIKDLGGKSSATVTAKLFPRSSVARAFSHQLAETLWLRGRWEAGTWAIGYAADDDRHGKHHCRHHHPNRFRTSPSRHARPIGVNRSRRSALPWPARSHQPTRQADNPRQGTIQSLTGSANGLGLPVAGVKLSPGGVVGVRRALSVGR